MELSACPEACPVDYAATCGEPCEVEGEACGNEIGDGRTCVSGMYECAVHAPLGPGCNLVCEPEEPVVRATIVPAPLLLLLTARGAIADPAAPTFDQLCDRLAATAASGDHLAVIVAFEALGETEAARCIRERDIQRPHVDAIDRSAYRAGVAAMKSGDLLAAREGFRAACEQDPYNQVAALRLAETQAKLDAEAQRLFGEAQSHEAAGETDQALAAYREVLEYSASAEAPLAVEAQARITALTRS